MAKTIYVAGQLPLFGSSADYQREWQRNFRRSPEGKLQVRSMNLRKHGLTIAQYDELAAAQNYLCASCGKPETGRNQFGPIPLAVDHDHTTKLVRALLCMRCNRTLGMLEDDADIIAQLVAYRRRFSNGKSIYCAGPMRGYKLFNFPAFAAAARELRQQGWTVFSPAEHDTAVGLDPANPDLEAQGFDVTQAFRWDINTLMNVEAVYFLRGWEGSSGAATEHAIAVSLALHRVYEDPRDEQKYVYLPLTAFSRSALDG